MYAGVSEAEKRVRGREREREGEREEATREVSVSHTTGRQTDRQGYIPSLRILMAACSLATQTL